MFGDGFEQATILRTGPDGLTRIITRTSWASRESLLVDGLVPRESSTMTRAKLLLRATR
jgi:hypothetical protein